MHAPGCRERPRGEEACHVTDGEDSTLKIVLHDLLGTRGVPPIERSAPFRIAMAHGECHGTVWRLLRLRSKPPVTRQTLRMTGRYFTLDVSRHATISVTYRSSTGLKASCACAIARAAAKGDEWSSALREKAEGYWLSKGEMRGRHIGDRPLSDPFSLGLTPINGIVLISESLVTLSGYWPISAAASSTHSRQRESPCSPASARFSGSRS